MNKNINESEKDAFSPKKKEHLESKILVAFGLPVIDKPQVILKEEKHKYKTIKESGVLSSSIFQSRQALLQGFIFKKFLNNSISKKQKNGKELVNKEHRISKIGEFTLCIELFSFPKTIFYLVKYITETSDHLLLSKDSEHYRNMDVLFPEKNTKSAVISSINNNFDFIKSEKELSFLLLNSNNDANHETYEHSPLFSEDPLFSEENYDPLKIEKTNKAIERLKIISLNSKFKEILYLIMSEQATLEQKTIFNLYMISSESSKIPFNYNIKEEILELHLFQNSKNIENEKYNEEITKIKQKKKNHEYMDAEIIFEFKENPGEKWILPKNIIAEKLGTNEPFEILASFIHIQDSLPQYFQPITLKITSCNQKLWDFILKYSNKKEKVFEIMSKILLGKRSEKLYFQHQILVTDTKTFKNEQEGKINIASPRNKKLLLSQKRKTVNENNTIVSSNDNKNNKSLSQTTLKKTKTKKYLTLPKDWYCSICNTTETPLKRRGPNGPGTLCNACGVKWKGGRGTLVPKD
ncbi:hypothetical protein PMAC_000910 [Pneumocystis sp. 'macacae']|nr:hypothetical protein PMAC_000910 [Pneumocystis sp. 'macacae']